MLQEPESVLSWETYREELSMGPLGLVFSFLVQPLDIISFARDVEVGAVIYTCHTRERLKHKCKCQCTQLQWVLHLAG